MTTRHTTEAFAEAFWSYTDRSGGCWVWTGSTDRDGYGKTDRDNSQRGRLAHRIAYELAVGPIPKGLEIDHLCRNRACVNPAHLEPVTHAENMRRRVLAQTHCKHGHEFTSENTRTRTRRNGWTERTCRPCNANAVRRYKARKREKTP